MTGVASAAGCGREPPHRPASGPSRRDQLCRERPLSNGATGGATRGKAGAERSEANRGVAPGTTLPGSFGRVVFRFGGELQAGDSENAVAVCNGYAGSDATEGYASRLHPVAAAGSAWVREIADQAPILAGRNRRMRPWSNWRRSVPFSARPVV